MNITPHKRLISNFPHPPLCLRIYNCLHKSQQHVYFSPRDLCLHVLSSAHQIPRVHPRQSVVVVVADTTFTIDPKPHRCCIVVEREGQEILDMQRIPGRRAKGAVRMQHGHQSQPPGSQENLQHSREYVRKIYELTDFYNKVIIFCAITFIVSARQRDSLCELGSADTDPQYQ